MEGRFFYGYGAWFTTAIRLLYYRYGDIRITTRDFRFILFSFGVGAFRGVDETTFYHDDVDLYVTLSCVDGVCRAT